MSRRVVMSLGLIVAAVAAGCRGADTPAPRQVVTVNRSEGPWQGSGNRTIGFVSDSGRFQVTWETRTEHAAGTGTFRLTVHSAVSGRPIQVLVDHRGEGRGIANFADDPRPYNFMVESANLEWSFAVEEAVGVERTDPPDARDRGAEAPRYGFRTFVCRRPWTVDRGPYGLRYKEIELRVPPARCPPRSPGRRRVVPERRGRSRS